MNWKYLNTGFNTGSFNMALDIKLAKLAGSDEAVLRLYRWKPYCISLGANQNENSINRAKAAKDNIDIVKRPTGGRAVLHSEELTYSVIIPVDQKNSARNIYREINSALTEGLNLYDKRLQKVDLETSQPDFRNLYKEEKSVVCFAAPAKSELKFEGKKLVGSAQRKMGNVILQHGSILCGDFHKKIVDYLTLTEENYSEVVSMLDSTADIKSITGQEVDYNSLCESIKEGFASFFSIEFNKPDEEILSAGKNDFATV